MFLSVLVLFFHTCLYIYAFAVFQHQVSYLSEMVYLTTVTFDWPTAPTFLEKLQIETSRLI